MGRGYIATCLDCGHEFGVREGGGFTFHVLHCDRCGRDRSVSFDSLGELQDRWTVDRLLVRSEIDANARAALAEYEGVEPISDDEYHAAVEASMKKCRCGGSFKFDAKPRCPKCRSRNFEMTMEGPTYD